MAWSDAARKAAAETRRRKSILNQPIDQLRRNKHGVLVIKKVTPSETFKRQVERVATNPHGTKVVKVKGLIGFYNARDASKFTSGDIRKMRARQKKFT